MVSQCWNIKNRLMIHSPTLTVGDTALTISAQSVKQIKNHMALSLQRMQELEEQVKVIPMMQVS